MIFELFNKNREEKSFKKDDSVFAVTIFVRIILFLVLYLPLFFFFRSDKGLYQWFLFYGGVNVLALINYLVFSVNTKRKIAMHPQIFQAFIIIIEIAIVTNIIYYSGGIFSNFSFLYIFTIISAAVSFNIIGAVISSIFVILSFGLVYYYQVQNLETIGNINNEILLKVYYFNVISFFAIGVIVGFLSKKIALASKKINEREKLSTIGEISSNLAHEIKNPLAAIRGSVQMLSNGNITNREKLTNLIIKETDRLDNLVKDFFAISKKREIEFEVFNVIELSNEILFLIMNNIEITGIKTYDLILIDEYPKGIVYSDRNLLKQILINLINNAIDESFKSKNKNRIEIKITAENEKVKIVVKDNCGGIDSEIFENIFLPFVSKKLKGSGLGLSVVKSLTDQLMIDLSYRNFKKNSEVIGTEFILSINKEKI